jgi:hypothetical protein
VWTWKCPIEGFAKVKEELGEKRGRKFTSMIDLYYYYVFVTTVNCWYDFSLPFGLTLIDIQAFFNIQG